MVDLSLYVIIDPDHCRDRPLTMVARGAVAGGATLLQYRAKTTPTRQMVEDARAILAAIAASNVPLLINDRVDVCLAAGAQGVHVGQDDMAAEDCRRLLGPDAIIGLTIKSPADVAAADIDALSYACIGGVYATSSKHNAEPPLGLEGYRLLRDQFRARKADFPVGAIAGITAETAPRLKQVGADGVAVISAVTMADDVEAAARDLKTAFGGAA